MQDVASVLDSVMLPSKCLDSVIQLVGAKKEKKRKKCQVYGIKGPRFTKCLTVKSKVVFFVTGLLFNEHQPRL